MANAVITLDTPPGHSLTTGDIMPYQSFFRVPVLLALLLPGLIFGEENEDKVVTPNGSITINPVLHGTLVLSWNGRTIYIDPFGGADGFKDIAPPDLVIITDIHGDHMNIETLEQVVHKKTLFVTPAAVAGKLPTHMKNELSMLANNESIEILGIKVTALPMYNLPETPESRHPRGRGNGYLLSIDDTVIYISGDTHDIAEMRSLRGIDIAFVCMNPPNTMSVEQAADAVREFKPAVVYPFHYRSRTGMNDVEEFKRLVEMDNTATEVRLRQWYPEA
jgi:L-ascorbate metabolism protein UlaG (beta-lactamase superfamily)